MDNSRFICKKATLALLAFMAFALSLNAQTFGLKTSGTQLLTLTPNVEFNVTAGKKVSFHLPVAYNPWVLGDNTRLQQLTCMPGMRFWFQQTHVHFFLSAYGIATRFHYGGLFNSKYRYDGEGYGGGIGAGYAYVINKHLNLECELGLGLIHADYDKCSWQKDSHRYSSESGVRIIPAKADISLVWFF